MKVAVFTGTRAEYGLLYWLLKDIQTHPDLRLQILASGSHLSPEFGHTVDTIVQDGFSIDEKVEVLLSSNTAVGTAKSIGLGVIGYSDALSRMSPDLIVILGDRFEALAAAQTAMILRIPVLHIHGGEVTEGAYDDSIRHAITKLSYLHATSSEVHSKRVIQLGEHPDRVKNVGAIGIDHLVRTKLLSREELSHSLSFDLTSPFLMVTYHPVTLADEAPVKSFEAILDALDHFPSHQVVLTYPNADDGGRAIIPLLEGYAAADPSRVFATPSLGQLRYLSAVKHADAVIGNSSSGVIEVPSFKVPTVNIGERQRGRLAAKSVIHAQARVESIVAGIKYALDCGNSSADLFENPYGSGDTSRKIIDMIVSAAYQPTKPFYDLP